MGDEAITALHEFGSNGIRPDRTLLLEVDDAARQERLAARDGDISDAIGGRSDEYHSDVAASFRALADADPQGFTVVDGTGTPGEVHNRIMEALAPFLNGIER